MKLSVIHLTGIGGDLNLKSIFIIKDARPGFETMAMALYIIAI
jgi:hypothetical protein